MFPFQTKKFSRTLTISDRDFENNLLKYAQQHRYISFKNERSRSATLSGVELDWAISEVPTKNSFRPVIVFKWQSVGDKTLLTGYYRLSKGILAISFAFLLFGMIVTIKGQSIYPIILFVFLWSLIFQVLGFLFFRKELDWVQGNFDNVISEILDPTKTFRHIG